ncbi:hypothetical protein TIFTF001_023490 [Ficus carica]|uniref:Uncharacterized protein n=1 Tax=Ficus carica TaxID=3494 RepID=A0AA88DDS2_FICCA|nr:hypothetical protein TIFTF001_023490 [Ficus carica]
MRADQKKHVVFPYMNSVEVVVPVEIKNDKRLAVSLAEIEVELSTSVPSPGIGN